MEELRHLFIINPAAGQKRSTARLEELISRLSVPHEIAYTQGEGDAERLAREAAQQGGPVRIYACGGDGTLNEVVNGAAGYENAAVTCVPKGTGNDFLKVFGTDYRTIFYDLEALAAGEEQPFDLIDCNGKLGIDVVCAGVDARVAEGVHRYKDLPLSHGIGAYCLSLVENIFKGLTRPMKIQMGPVNWEGETAILCVCNGRHYGGGFMPMPEAMPDDGVLDMLLVPKVSTFTFVRLLGQYARGNYKKYPQLIMSHHGQELTYSSEREIVTVVDGEVMRDTHFTVRISEKKINFFYPVGASYVLKSTEKIGTLAT